MVGPFKRFIRPSSEMRLVIWRFGDDRPPFWMVRYGLSFAGAAVEP